MKKLFQRPILGQIFDLGYNQALREAKHHNYYVQFYPAWRKKHTSISISLYSFFTFRILPYQNHFIS